MVRRVLLGCTLLLAVATSVRAQTLLYEHDGSPLFSVEIAAGWEVDLDFEEEARDADAHEEGEQLEIRIVEIRPNDGGHVWVGLWAIPDVANLDEAADYLANLNQDLFTDLEVSALEDQVVNGMPTRTAAGSGVHEGEEVELILTLFEPRDGVVAAGFYVGAVDAWKTYIDALRSMADSVEPAS